MNDQPRQALCKLIQETGNHVFSEPTFGSLLSDYFKGDFKKERYVLLESIREDIPHSLLSKSVAIPYNILSSQLIQKLIHCGYAEDLATWAIDSWAIAFTIIPLDYSRNIPSIVKPSAITNDATIPAVFQIKETDILAFTPIQFKIYMKEMFEQIGYVVTLAPPSNNFVDFVISGQKGDIVVITKKYSKSVSTTIIERIIAAKRFYNANKAVAITTSSFSDSAIDLANSNDVDLWDCNSIINIFNSDETKSSLIKSIIEHLQKFCMPRELDVQQITKISVKILEVAIGAHIYKSRTNDDLLNLAIYSNFSNERKIGVILDLLKIFEFISSYNEVSAIYDAIRKDNRDFIKKPGSLTFYTLNAHWNYENMALTVSYEGTCPICENEISGTPINRKIYDPTKTYHLTINCSHCSFHHTTENFVSDSMKEQILNEASTHKKDPDIDLFE